MFSSLTRLFTPGAALLLLFSLAACGDSGDGNASGGGATTSTTSGSGGAAGGGGDTTAPTVVSTSPADAATDVVLNTNVTATFNEAMAAATLTSDTFVVRQGDTTVPAAVTYAGTVATLEPAADLAPNAVFSVTITTDVTDVAGNPLTDDTMWTFETGTTVAQGPAPVNLGTSGHFVILAKSGIDTIPTSALTGDIGASPIDSTSITGFSLTMDSSGTFSTSDQVTGRVYAADYTSPTPSDLTTAVSNIEGAYTDAAGRQTPDFTEALGSGDISGLTLVPGLYKWGTGVLISTDVTLAGGPKDIWIFQIGGGITVAAGAHVVLSGGALPKNIFWQTAGAVAIETTAHLEGVVLSQTEITLATGATINGRLLSQTAVTLDACTVTQPSP